MHKCVGWVKQKQTRANTRAEVQDNNQGFKHMHTSSIQLFRRLGTNDYPPKRHNYGVDVRIMYARVYVSRECLCVRERARTRVQTRQ
eukprot:m.284767 g.284767  ORF g.284767 m.284767 type:complete len:87 (+) comp177393_c0_seq1:42-302(+)